ncbi:hypothetical protein CZ797_13775 [Pseudoalteromonas sp. JB197]|nr:hypothetical protein CZ797_13775 [Pseudoalteromonas sp. JB197]
MFFNFNQRGIKPRLQQTPTCRREFTSRNVFLILTSAA